MHLLESMHEVEMEDLCTIPLNISKVVQGLFQKNKGLQGEGNGE
jgi:hypothetical protein